MLPKNLKYGSKVESAMARSYRTNIAPQNGTGSYNLGDTIIVNIPTRNNLVLVGTESYLKFNLNVTNSANAGNYARWDSCGAHCLFQRLRIFHGSNLLQDIDNYPMLAKLLFDLQVATDASMGKFNVLAGTRSDYVSSITTAAGAAPITTADATDLATANALAIALKGYINGGFSVQSVNSGDAIFSNLGSANTMTPITYCLNLISLLGTLSSSNYIPLFAITSAPLRIELQLVDQPYKLGAAINTFTPTLTNVEYIGNFIELSDTAVEMVMSSLQGQPLQFVVPDYRNFSYTYSIAAGSATQVAMPIPAKFSSLKSLFVMARDTSQVALQYFPWSTLTLYLSDYQFRVGSQLMPTKAVNTNQEQFSELLKAMGSMSDLSHQPAIDSSSYLGVKVKPAAITSAASILTTQSGSFYIGLDLENYCTAPRDTIFTGYNSNTDDIFAIINFVGTNGTAINARFDAFALFDEVVVFENGTAYVKF